MKDQDFEVRVERWLNDRPSRLRKIGRSVIAYRYTKFRSFSIWTPTHWFSRTGMASSGPGIAYASGNTLTLAKAATLFGALFIGHSVVSYVGKRSAGKKPGPNPAVLDMIVRIGDVLSGMKPGRAKPDEVRSAICSALGSRPIAFGALA